MSPLPSSSIRRLRAGFSGASSTASSVRARPSRDGRPSGLATGSAREANRRPTTDEQDQTGQQQDGRQDDQERERRVLRPVAGAATGPVRGGDPGWSRPDPPLGAAAPGAALGGRRSIPAGTAASAGRSGFAAAPARRWRDRRATAARRGRRRGEVCRRRRSPAPAARPVAAGPDPRLCRRRARRARRGCGRRVRRGWRPTAAVGPP